MNWFRSDAAGLFLAQECEAFLAGTFAELTVERDERVPPWAWLNLLAHGTSAQLRAEAQRHYPLGSWPQARAFLAGKLIDLDDVDPGALAELQHHVLVPIELEAIGCGAAHWRPGAVVTAVLEILDARRPDHPERPDRGG